MKNSLQRSACASLRSSHRSRRNSRLGSVALLAAATTTETGEAMAIRCANRTFQATGTTSAGAGAAVVIIEASDKPTPVTSTNVDWSRSGRSRSRSGRRRPETDL